VLLLVLVIACLPESGNARASRASRDAFAATNLGPEGEGWETFQMPTSNL